LAATRAEFEKIEREEWSDTQPALGQWASPLQMVEKADGSLRPCAIFGGLI
jgi:hypothetical protein